MAMATDSGQAARREELSALLDGELVDARVAAVCHDWRECAPSRAAWHAYHLIGDTLRSDDLGTEPARDAAFLEALRARLADEPVVMAPKRLESMSPVAHRSATRGQGAAPARRRGWLAPTAIAAGFMAVAAVMVLTTAPVTVDERLAGNRLVGGTVAPDVRGAAAVPAAPPAPTPRVAVPNEPPTVVADGPLIRNARLDRYLSAHQQFAGSSALGVPSGFMRHATADAGPR